MGKLILLAIIALAAALYFPESRAVLIEKGEPVLRPLLEWNAEREIEEIVSSLQRMEEVERRLPTASREYVRWLEENYTSDAATDPWGTVYGYELQKDSFAVISSGPDREMRTADDLRDVRIRNWRAKTERRP
jgi:hypothetical protein